MHTARAYLASVVCRSAVFAAIAVVSAAATAAVAQSAAPFDYRLGPGDEVRIEVEEAPQLDATQRVAADGTVTLAFIGKIDAEGSTLSELEGTLKTLLEESYVTRATVAVELLEVRARPVTVLGAVANPGRVGYEVRWTLTTALNAAGGVTAKRGEHVTVQRRADNGLSDSIEIPLDELLSGSDPRLDLPLFPNDRIHVEPARQITVYLLGEIATRGALRFEDGDRATVLTAVARAGGLTDRASPKIRIRREGPEGTEEIEVHYRRLLDGEEENVALEDGDLLIVKEAFF